MEPEAKSMITEQVRQNLILAGMVDNRIEPEPLEALVEYIHESARAFTPGHMANAYLAIAWTLKKTKNG
jgi:hypothetical protein